MSLIAEPCFSSVLEFTVGYAYRHGGLQKLVALESLIYRDRAIVVRD